MLDVAKEAIEAVAAHVRMSENLFPGLREVARHFLATNDQGIPDHLRRPYLTMGHPERGEALACLRDAAIFQLWSESKVVYAMDDRLIDYLSDSSSSAIPTSVLLSIPHPNPFVLLPEPDFDDPEIGYYRTHIGIPFGAFVFGRHRNAEQLCSTGDERREDLGLMFVGLLVTHGEPILQMLRCTIPLGGATFTVEEAVSATVTKFVFNADLGEDDGTKLASWLRRYVALAFNSLLYVCTDQPDVAVQHPSAGHSSKKARKKAARRARPDDIDTLVTLGFRLGPALYEARTRSETQPQAREAGADEPGTRKRPHQRRGHYHTYWTGSGRRTPTLKWVPPFWVNRHLLDAPNDVTVRPVRRRPEFQ